jgi:Tfp pilus assembly protein PilO
MAKNSKAQGPAANGQSPVAQRVRVALGVLVALNLIAAGFVFYTPGGSAESLERDLARLQGEVRQARTRVEQTRQNVASVEQGRSEGDQFLNAYFAGRRTAFSALLGELTDAARESGLTERGTNYSTVLIEGSETLGTVTISANYEGIYQSLLGFVRKIDASPSLLIIESLNAAPQQGSNRLNLTVKLNAFYREDGSMPLVAEAAAEQAATEEAGQ